MRYGASILLAFLIASLLIQNTCPRGFAGKTAVAASCCAHCPLMKMHAPPTSSAKLGLSANAPVHLPLFLLDMPMMRPAFRLAATAIPQPGIPNTYKNAAPDELFRPPCA